MKPSSRFLKVLRRSLLGVALAATAIALFVTVENWRGDRAWAEVERDLKSRGDLPSIPAIPSPPIPDDQNFFKTPLLARLLYDRPDDLERKKLLAETRLMDFGILGESLSSPIEFSSLRTSMRKRGLFTSTDSESPAADVLLSLERLRPLLDEISNAALARPAAALDAEILSLAGPQLIAFDPIFVTAKALATRAAIQLELGQIEAAYNDTIAVLRLGNELSSTPSANLISLLVGVAMHGIASPAITFGCEHRLWNEPQLAAIDLLLGKLHPLLAFRTAIKNERVFFFSALDTRPLRDPKIFNWPSWFFHGLAQQNKVTYSLTLDRTILGSFTVQPDRILSLPTEDHVETRRRTPEAGTFERFLHPYSWVSQMALLNLDHLLQGLGSSIDRLALLRIACAIERHRLAAGVFPEKLEQLVPKFLPAVPTGIFDGQPLQLRNTPEGGYEIYFFGRDASDNQGTGDDISLKFPVR